VLRTAITVPAEEPPRRYDPPHILWYFGAIASALTANATILSVGPSARGTWQLLLALLFLFAFGAASLLLLQAGWRVAGGALVVTTVAMVPTVGQAFERLIGVWPDGPTYVVATADVAVASEDGFQGALFALALVTLAAGLIAFSVVRFPFIFVTVTVSAVVAAQLLVPAIVDGPSANDRASVFIATGAAFVLVGFVLDSVGRGTDAFWWHTTGLFAVALGLGWYGLVRDDGWAWVAILLIGITLVLASAPFNRATWTTYGVIAVWGAMLQYATDWVGSWRQPALMLAVSVGLVLVGLVLQLYARAWAARLHRPAPAPAPAPPAAAVPPPLAEPPPAIEEPPAAPLPRPEPEPEPEPGPEPPDEAPPAPDGEGPGR
jgi:hypothetical protein